VPDINIRKIVRCNFVFLLDFFLGLVKNATTQQEGYRVSSSLFAGFLNPSEAVNLCDAHNTPKLFSWERTKWCWIWPQRNKM